MPGLPVVTDARHRLHDVPFELGSGQVVAPVFETPGRIDAIAAVLDAGDHAFVDPTEHGDGPVLAVHDADMVAFLRDGHDHWRAAGGPEVMIADTYRHPAVNRGGRRSASPTGQLGWWCYDTATGLVAGSYAATRAAVDVALSGADRIAAGDGAVYALTRPPGHHAGPDYFGGFCLLNPVAVAARALTAGGRVAVLDLDAHHGNGTQDVFWRDDDVAYVSLHGDPDHLYPYFSGYADEVGEGPGRGTTTNLPLPAAAGDDAYLAALDRGLDAVTAHRPATLLISLGLDAHVDDPVGSLSLSSGVYADLGRRVADLGLPTLVVQEGGYALDRIGPAARAFLAAFPRAARGG